MARSWPPARVNLDESVRRTCGRQAPFASVSGVRADAPLMAEQPLVRRGVDAASLAEVRPPAVDAAVLNLTAAGATGGAAHGNPLVTAVLLPNTKCCACLSTLATRSGPLKTACMYMRQSTAASTGIKVRSGVVSILQPLGRRAPVQQLKQSCMRCAEHTWERLGGLPKSGAGGERGAPKGCACEPCPASAPVCG